MPADYGLSRDPRGAITVADSQATLGAAGDAAAGASAGGQGFARHLGVRSGMAVNMTQLCGIGPFITIPRPAPDAAGK